MDGRTETIKNFLDGRTETIKKFLLSPFVRPSIRQKFFIVSVRPSIYSSVVKIFYCLRLDSQLLGPASWSQFINDNDGIRLVSPRKRPTTATAATTMKNFLNFFPDFVRSKFFPETDRDVAIQSVQKSPKSELSSQFFSRLKIFRSDRTLLRYKFSEIQIGSHG